MKNFDLNACGVVEMNEVELQDINGGLSFSSVYGTIVSGAVGIAAGLVGLPVVAATIAAGALGLAASETHDRGTLYNMNQASVKLWN